METTSSAPVTDRSRSATTLAAAGIFLVVAISVPLAEQPIARN